MKIIEAMKKIKDLQIKAEDLRKKAATYCADYDYETPHYPDQKRQIAEWMQAHSDILKEILRLRVAIQRTNLATSVVISLAEKNVTKTIAEWIHRRRDLATLEMDAWLRLGDRGLKESAYNTSAGESKLLKIRRYFDQTEKDKKTELYRSEPHVIDSTLEVVNATTELLE